MESGPEIFLDALCLAIYCNDIETEKILENILAIYKIELTSRSPIIDDLAKVYIKFVTNIYNKTVNLSNNAELQSFLLGIEQQKVIKDNPKILDRFNIIIS